MTDTSGAATVDPQAAEEAEMMEAFERKEEGAQAPSPTPPTPPTAPEPPPGPAPAPPQGEATPPPQAEPAPAPPAQGEPAPATATAETPPADPPTIEQLMQRMEALDRSIQGLRGESELTSKQFSKVYGSIGKAKREWMKQAEQLAKRQLNPISFRDEDFSELEEEFPTMKELLTKGINRGFSRYNPFGEAGPHANGQPQPTVPITDPTAAPPAGGTPPAYPTGSQVVPPTSDPTGQAPGGPSPAAPTDDFGAFNADQHMADYEMERAKHHLETMIPGWQQIVGTDGTFTPYRHWLSQQAPDYIATVAGTLDPQIVGASIYRYFDYERSRQQTAPAPGQAPPPAAPHPPQAPPPQPPPVPHLSRFGAAAVPAGTGGSPPPRQAKTEEEEMEEAFFKGARPPARAVA